MAKNDQYATLNIGPKKIGVCSRRIGSRDRMGIIAICTEEAAADKIVDALNLLQGKLAELEVPAQRVLSEVREQLTRAGQATVAANGRVRDLERMLNDTKRELDRAKEEVRRAELARDAAQKTARETA